MARRSRMLVRASAALLSLGAAAQALMAQGAPSAQLPRAQICDMSYRVLIMQLVDSSGAPVKDATLKVRRVRTGRFVERDSVGSDGSYQVLADGMLRDLRRNGEFFDVIFTRGARVRRVRVRIGMDAGGCHVRFVTIPAKVVI